MDNLILFILKYHIFHVLTRPYMYDVGVCGGGSFGCSCPFRWHFFQCNLNLTEIICCCIYTHGHHVTNTLEQTTATQLSFHMQKFIAVVGLIFGLKQNEIYIEFELLWKIVSECGNMKSTALCWKAYVESMIYSTKLPRLIIRHIVNESAVQWS